MVTAVGFNELTPGTDRSGALTPEILLEGKAGLGLLEGKAGLGLLEAKAGLGLTR